MSGKDPASFEDLVDRLEGIVARLESSELSLEDSMTAYEEAVRLAQEGRRRLDAAERRIEEITATLETAEARVVEIDETFCQPNYFEQTPAQEVHALEQERNSLQSRLTDLMTEWERLEEEIDSLEAN